MIGGRGPLLREGLECSRKTAALLRPAADVVGGVFGELVGRRAGRRAGAALAQAVGKGGELRWIGLEHEFLVYDAHGARVDFRTVIHGLGLGRRNLVPSDPFAYGLPTGSQVTADSTEAEIAVPPAQLRPGFTHLVDGWAAFERRQLAAAAPTTGFVGDSTHLSIALPDGANGDRVATLFARHFSAGLMLLLDRRHSPGLLVRPRPYRLELGGEYAVGRPLRAALAYATGAALACYAAASGSMSAKELPPRLMPRLERGILRYGWYVSRSAFGGDLYATVRDTPLRDTAGRRFVAGEHLKLAWDVARWHLEPLVGAADLDDADALVDGGHALPCEMGPAESLAIAAPIRPRSAFGSALRPRRRPAFHLAPVMLSWQTAVFVVAGTEESRRAFVAVPGMRLEAFVAALDDGRLDAPVEAYLAARASPRTLRSARDARTVGIFDRLGLRCGLLAPERDYWGRPIRLRLRRRAVAPVVAAA